MTINEAAKLLRLTRGRIYQLVYAGQLVRRGKSLDPQAVLERAFAIEKRSVIYRPLGWKLSLRMPALKRWPVCGIKTADGSVSVSADEIPQNLSHEDVHLILAFALKVAVTAILQAGSRSK